MSLLIAMLLQASVAETGRTRVPMPVLKPCILPGTVEVQRLAQLPEAVQVELQRFFQGGMGEAFGPFNSTDWVDSVHPVPQRRFLRAYRREERWIVWYQHGGIGHHFHAVAVDQASGQPARMFPFASFGALDGKTLCADSRAILDGATTSIDL